MRRDENPLDILYRQPEGEEMLRLIDTAPIGKIVDLEGSRVWKQGGFVHVSKPLEQGTHVFCSVASAILCVLGI